MAGGGAEGGTVMVAVGETGGADITLDGSAVTMAVDGTGRAAGGGRWWGHCVGQIFESHAWKIFILDNQVIINFIIVNVIIVGDTLNVTISCLIFLRMSCCKFHKFYFL